MTIRLAHRPRNWRLAPEPTETELFERHGGAERNGRPALIRARPASAA
jgi:hypothetical protein